MIEPELAFADLNDNMACATAYLQYVVKYILENCKEDMDFFNTWIEKGIINRLNDVVEKDFVQLTYSDAVELLLGAKKKFEFPPVDQNNVAQPDKTLMYDSAVGLSKHIYWLLQTNKLLPIISLLLCLTALDLYLFVLSNLTLIALEPTFHATCNRDISMEPPQGIEHTASTLRTWDLINSSGNSLADL